MTALLIYLGLVAAVLAAAGQDESQLGGYCWAADGELSGVVLLDAGELDGAL